MSAEGGEMSGFSDPQRARDYMREYMRRYRAQPEAQKIACLGCGATVPASRYLYCSKRCVQRLAARRYRQKNPQLYLERNRRYRESHRAESQAACRKWEAAHPGHHKTETCPTCGEPMWNTAIQCRRCKLAGQLCRAKDCQTTQSHRHCIACGEPIFDRRHTLCLTCVGERDRLHLTTNDFRRYLREEAA